MRYWPLILIFLAMFSGISAGKNGCHSQCSGGTAASNPTSTPKPSGGGWSGGDVGSIITSSLFEQMLKYRNDPSCERNGFYTYNAFIKAARSFRGFGTSGELDTRKRELAAFLGQTSHATSGAWPRELNPPGGLYEWGYCFIKENTTNSFCTSNKYPCAPGKRYYGRGPIQLRDNYNYGKAGQAIGQDLINNPDLVSSDATISFKTAIWFWMTPQDDLPSSHDVITKRWRPSNADKAANRLPGYGVITNIIHGTYECGSGAIEEQADRIGYYKRYCDILKVGYGDNVDCYDQRPFKYV